MINEKQAKDFATKLQSQIFATSTLKIQLPSSTREEAQTLQDRFSALFGNAILYDANSKLHYGKTSVEKSIWVIESAILSDDLDKLAVTLRDVLLSVKWLWNVQTIIVQIDNFTIPV